MTTTEQNRQLITHLFDELARDNPMPFSDALAEDVRWITSGRSVWSRTFEGKARVQNDLLGMVRKQLVARVRLHVHRILADGNRVVVEADGQATTKRGKQYDNQYCLIYRIECGKIMEVTEYIDTQLACDVLEAPWAAEPARADHPTT
jgi:ketosteroid isomerase-like protein